MKKVLSILGGIFLVLILIVAVFIGIYHGNGLDASSKAYVEANVKPIVTTWSLDELAKRSSPKLVDILKKNPGQAEQYFAKLSKLGTLKTLGEPKGQAHVAVNTGTGKVISATYRETAEFQNGKADLIINLIQEDGQWRLLGFSVNSPILPQ
ncbi:hypothetical protein [Dyella subtropica]|uniref:hypothetical protein n=1 Tax=Dyella subtropica TaxID=2992127 RepID=UPI002259DC62|nr:hypothetical protein [Dyella subtropica]